MTAHPLLDGEYRHGDMARYVPREENPLIVHFGRLCRIIARRQRVNGITQYIIRLAIKDSDKHMVVPEADCEFGHLLALETDLQRLPCNN